MYRAYCLFFFFLFPFSFSVLVAASWGALIIGLVLLCNPFRDKITSIQFNKFFVFKMYAENPSVLEMQDIFTTKLIQIPKTHSNDCSVV